MMVAAVDDGDGDRSARQFMNGVKPAKSGSDDDNAMGRWLIRQCFVLCLLPRRAKAGDRAKIDPFLAAKRRICDAKIDPPGFPGRRTPVIDRDPRVSSKRRQTPIRLMTPPRRRGARRSRPFSSPSPAIEARSGAAFLLRSPPLKGLTLAANPSDLNGVKVSVA
jgi:hypothetical protein